MTRITKTTLPDETAHEAPFVAGDVPVFNLPDDMVLNARTFGRYMRLVDMLGRRTGLTVDVDQQDDALKQGDIFLFNHFTRFETVVAPYIIFRETGVMARSVAYSGLFDVNDTMSRVLHQSGGVPTNLPRLLPFLAEEILRGRKVIIFPEGGLVKDKSVLDANGNLTMWSGSAEKVRKPHRGAALLATMLDLTKRRIRTLMERDDTVQLANWCAHLNMSLDDLKIAVAKPTLIVPGNITFYPMRTNPNLLVRSLEKIAGPQGPRARDELTIEGNLLLRPTDMNVRFGQPIAVERTHSTHRGRLKETMLDHAVDHLLEATRTVDEVFGIGQKTGSVIGDYAAKLLNKRIDSIRDDYARRIYMGTTININHLTATLVRLMVEQGRWDMSKESFHNVLYVALKALQQRNDVNLHPTLSRPELYGLLREGRMRGFVGFLEACTRARLIKVKRDTYVFSRRLMDPMDLQDIRLENPLQVHVNEATPVAGVRAVLAATLARVETIDAVELAKLRFDDMVRAHTGQRYKYGKLAPHTLLGADSSHTGRPYLLLPELMGKRTRKQGVVLVHGFATSPGELRTYADHLRELGHTVLAVRLPGHGTSPLDLETRTREEWIASVREGYEIMAALTDEVVMIGFSTGGALALKLAAEARLNQMPKLVRVASVAAPMLVQDSNMNLLPVGMMLRAVLKRIPGLKDALRFYDYERDTSAAVYPRVPVTALNELRLTIREMRKALPKVTLPVLLVQGLLDHTVQPRGASMMFRLLSSTDKTLRWIAGGPHALITHNFGATWDILDAFVGGKDVTGISTGPNHKHEHAILAEARPNKKTRARWFITRKATA
ncbi:MAG: hypothetical protein DI585_02820 [Pseudomonas fluorescens]|nr:MAG: hypothetical protein DI585_02820 [Pseudomonas fluorescens]